MDEVDAELARLILWTAFAAASLARPETPADPADPLTLTAVGRATRDADNLLTVACQRFPFLAEPVT